MYHHLLLHLKLFGCVWRKGEHVIQNPTPVEIIDSAWESRLMESSIEVSAVMRVLVAVLI